MASVHGPKLIAGNSNLKLARSVARRMSLHRGMNVDLVDARVERFNDGEIFVEVFENVRDEDMFIIQPTSRPANDALMELLIIADALKRSSASLITAVIPYFGYARQDRRSKARTPITAKLVANMLEEAGIERVLTLDLHATQIQGFFDIPVDNLYASPVFALDVKHHFKDQMDNLMVVSPDVGGVARARDLAQRIGAPLSIVDKRREKAGAGGARSSYPTDPEPWRARCVTHIIISASCVDVLQMRSTWGQPQIRLSRRTTCAPALPTWPLGVSADQ